MDFVEYFKENVFSVTEINEYVKATLDAVPVFSSVRIRGEISNFKNHAKTGHMYFSLKDEGSVIRAVMFSRDARGLKFIPEDGIKVVAEGRVSVFPRDGVYQLYVESMKPDGQGALHAAFERLKNKLESEGLFSSEYKKPLPRFPRRVGVITSPDGAALRDIINITGRRFPLAEILVYPALVQGEGAIESLCSGVRYMSDIVSPDVVIIGRGGGSIEDLWAFNSEKLARLIAASPIPFISAVGHETDFTICDFVSSVRAPTPSGAAELAVPDVTQIYEQFNVYGRALCREMQSKIDVRIQKLEALSSKRVMTSPYGFVDERRQKLASLYDRAESRFKLLLSDKKVKYSGLCEKLNALSPLSVLGRGYGAVFTFGDSSSVITETKGLNIGDKITLRMQDGEADAEVTAVRKAKARRVKKLIQKRDTDNE